MSKYNRYIFCKRIYSDYLILIKDKDKVISFDEDLEIINLYGLRNILNMNINYCILNGLDIELNNNYDNDYFYYFKINLLKEIIDYIYKYKT